MSKLSTTMPIELPTKLAKQVKEQFAAFSRVDMAAFTLQKQKSDFKGARSDLFVCDGSGQLKLLGRDFGGQIFFWQP
jgi:hypothetical protein